MSLLNHISKISLIAAVSFGCGALHSGNVFAAESDSETWTDSKTGLTWARCPLGTKLSGGDCLKDEKIENRFSWWEAMIAVDSADHLGSQDWRVPTNDEYLSILTCQYPEGSEEEKASNFLRQQGKSLNDDGSPPGCLNAADAYPDQRTFPDGNTWTSSPVIGAPSYLGPVAYFYSGIQWKSVGQSDRNPVFLVRGGKTPATYEAAIATARANANAEVFSKAKKADDLKKYQEERAAADKQIWDQGKAIDAKNRAYKESIPAFRKNVKRGDMASNGLVLQVKGDLIKVQAQENRCVQESPTINAFTHQHECWKFAKVITGEVWVKRSEILPAK